MKTIEERFWAKVDKAPGHGPNGECWLWTAAKWSSGYGCFALTHRKSERAHRTAFALSKGEIPSDKLVCHKCDVRACVNPGHLFLGSPQENMKDMWDKGRGAKGLRQGAYTRPDRKPKGERHGMSLLTEEKVRQIRYLAGLNYYFHGQLAKFYGVKRRNICTVVSGQTWGHVSGLPSGV